MTVTQRSYHRSEDFDRVGRFLIRHYQSGNRDGNWLQPTWEYMHFHPMLEDSSLDRIRIWEDSGELIAVVHYEAYLGEAFFQIHPAFETLKPALLDGAETHLNAVGDSDRRYIQAFINDSDPGFTALVQSRGYQRVRSHDRPLAAFKIPKPFPAISLPAGFRLKSLADEPDWAKVHRVLWRGFNHEGEPPAGDDELEDRRKMFDTPNARRDLKIVVAAPNGDFVSICGMWFEPVNRYAYVEPVATDPDYRRLGLGRAAVLEGIRRCGLEGATVAYVGSDQPFYLALGFDVLYTARCWQKFLD